MELKEEFTRILTANNPHAPSNIVRFSHKVINIEFKMNYDLAIACSIRTLYNVITDYKVWTLTLFH